jgi:outer membrane protein
MFKLKQSIAAAAIGWALSTGAQAADLFAVVQQALGHDAELAQARAGRAAAAEAIPQARAALLPQISGGWGRAYNSIETQGIARVSYWQSGWMVSLTQPVFDWTRWQTLRQADYVDALGTVKQALVQKAVVQRAIRAYFDALAAEDEVERVSSYGAAVDEQIRILRRNRSAGEATIIDLREALTAREQVVLQQSDARSVFDARQRALEQLTGTPYTPLLRLPDTFALPPLAPDDVEAWASQAQDASLDVQQKQLELQIAKYDVEKVEGDHMPSVYLTGSYTPSGAAAGYARPTTTSTGMLTISIPLYSGGATQSKVREAEALQDKAREALTGATNAADASARNQFARIHEGRTRIDTLVRLVESCRETLAVTQVGFKVGTRTSTDVLRATDALYSTQRDLLTARYDTIVAVLELRSSAAALSVWDIERISAMLVSQGTSLR